MSDLLRLRDYALVLHDGDNVATAMRHTPAGTYALPDGGELHVPTDVKTGFKIAVQAIAASGEVRKYGYRIALATEDIAPGACVHVHNTRSGV